MKSEAAMSAPEKKRPLKEIIDESLVQLNEPDEDTRANAKKKENVAKGVAESFIDGVEDGSVDLKTVPENDIPAWYDAVKAKYRTWRKKADQLESRVPMLDADIDESPATPPPFFGEKGKRSRDMIAAEAIHELSDTSAADAKKKRGAERTAESFLDEIESGDIDLSKIPEQDIPGYHAAVMKKVNLWQTAMKTLEARVKDVEEEDVEDHGPNRLAA